MLQPIGPHKRFGGLVATNDVSLWLARHLQDRLHESKDDLKRRICEANRYVSTGQLCLSPQCGFASTEEGNTLAEAE